MLKNYFKNRALLGPTLVFFVLFAFMRLYQLDVRPLHNDEGVNAFFLTNLIKSNSYKYDPNNYHGPTLYYFHLIPVWIDTLLLKGPKEFRFNSIDGLNEWSLRVPVALAGLLVLIGILCCAHRIGPMGALAAFILSGFSIDLLYFSRYFIHEIYFVLFTLWLYLGISYFALTRKNIYLYLAAVSGALIFCTKETSVITYFILYFSFVCTEFTHFYLSTDRSLTPWRDVKRKTWATAAPFFQEGYVMMVMVLIWLFLYSSFLKNGHGLLDSFLTYFKWTKEGLNSGHAKPFFYFMKVMLLPYELPLTLFSLMGLFYSVKKNEKAGLYLTFWTLGMVGAYSLIPYKTPWCVINMLLPMALLSGYGVQSLWEEGARSGGAQSKMVWPAMAILILFFIPRTLRAVYTEADLAVHPQAYVHTSRDIYNMRDQIDHVARVSELGSQIKINFVSKEYWPWPFYMRKYPNALFWGKFDDIGPVDAPLIVADSSAKEELKKYLKDSYEIQEYVLRPNYLHHLYINKKYAGTASISSTVLPDLFPAQSPSPSLSSGLLKKVFSGIRCQGRPLKVQEGLADVDFRWEKESQKEVPSPFSMEWKGYLQIPQEGDYALSAESDDGSLVYVDGYLVIDNGNSHVLTKKLVKIKLAAGFHHLLVQYFDSGGEAIMKLSWIKPNQGEEVIPKEVLFHTPEKPS